MAKQRELERIFAAGRRLYEGGLVAGSGGAIGVRLSSGEIVVSRAGSRLGFLGESDMVVMNGNRVPAFEPREEAVRDAGLISAVFEARPEAGSVLRVESPYAIALAHKGRGYLEKSREKLRHLGRVVFVNFYRPGTAGLAGAVSVALQENDIAIVEGQGPVVWGRDVDEAVDRAEALEAATKVIFILEESEKDH